MMVTAVIPAAEHPAFAQSRSAADIAQARELFNEGIRLREQGDLPGAIEKLRAAHAVGDTPITGRELGRAYVAAGKLVEAREAFLSVARIVPQPAETARSKTARDDSVRLAEQVRARIPSVTLRVTGASADDVTVSLDGALVPTEALSAPRLVNPGRHTVTAVAARSNQGPDVETTVEVAEGESRDVELKFVPVAPARVETGPASGNGPQPPASAEVPASEATRGSTTPNLGAWVYVGFGVAAAGVGVGAVTGILSFSKAAAVKRACQGELCPLTVDSDLRTGRALGTASTIAFAAAGAGAVLGVFALVLPHHDEPQGASTKPPIVVRPWLSAMGAGLDGSF